MDVRCEKCSTEYEFDEERVGANGVTVKCTACGFVFKVRRPRKVVPPPRATTTLGKGPQGREWLVRKPDGQMIAFRELTTLQKWIVEGRIARDDEISKNGETWKRLGNILELEPFFSVYEKARALNDLIDRGGEGQPVALRGSEVLASMNPLSSLPLDGAHMSGPISPAIARAETIGPDYAHASSLSRTERGQLNASAASLMSPVAPPPLPAPTNPPQGFVPAESSSPSYRAPSGPGNGFGASTGSMPKLRAPSTGSIAAAAPPPTPSSPSVGLTVAPLSATIPPVSSSSEHLSTGLAGPGALDAAPLAIGSITPSKRAPSLPRSHDTLAISIDDEDSRSDPLESFERQQKTKRIWAYAALLIVLGAGGGIALAKFGPSGNPLQVYAERYGLLQPRIIDDGATRHIEEAQRAIDLDTLASLQKAEGLLELAEKTRPNDPAVRGDRALVMITRAEALRRAASDMGLAADEADRAKAAWAALSKQIRDRNLATGGNEQPPPQPVTPDSAALRVELTKNSEVASGLLKQAFDIAAGAFRAAPDAFEPARALSEYYRVQQDMTGYARELARAKAVAEKSGATDPSLLYGEAAALTALSRPSPEDYAKAAQLLEQSLSIRPSMNRARVLHARVSLARQAPEAARSQLERVLAAAPDHQEARWLRDVATKNEREKAPQAAAAAIVEPATAPAADKKEPQPVAPAQPEQGKKDRVTKDLDNGAKNTFENWMTIADRNRERDRPKQALNAYEKAADLKPNSAEPLTGMGWAYIDLEKPEAALNMFRRALKVNDRYAEAYYGQAEALRLVGRKDEAINAYEQYLSRAPNGADRKAAQRALEQLKQ